MIKNTNEIVAKLVRKTGLKKWKSNLLKNTIKKQEDNTYPLNLTLQSGTYALPNELVNQIANRYEVSRYQKIISNYIDESLLDASKDITDLIVLFGVCIRIDNVYRSMADTKEFDNKVVEFIDILSSNITLSEEITSKQAVIKSVKKLDKKTNEKIEELQNDLVSEIKDIDEDIIENEN